MERFIAVKTIVESGSFTKAAEELGYTQPALSQSVASLEKQLGFSLLIRSRAGVSLSPDGQEIYPYIDRLVRDYESTLLKADEMNGLEHATIRFSTFTSIAIHVLPDLLSDFRKKYRNVDFVIKSGDERQNLQMIREGAVDFAFITEEYQGNLQGVYMQSDEMKAVLPKNHPLARKKVVRPEDFEGLDFIADISSEAPEKQDMLQKNDIHPHVRYSTENDNSILAMVEAGLGVSILNTLSLMDLKADVEVRPIRPRIQRRVMIVYKDKKMLPIGARRFIEFMVKRRDARMRTAD